MSTVAFVGIPAAGHLNPTLPVVARLRAGGDRVVYYAPERAGHLVEPAGAEFRALPEPTAPTAPPRHPAEMRAMLLRAAHAAPWLAAELSALRPDVVVHDSCALVGALAARAAAIPTVSATTTFAFGPGVPAPGREPAGPRRAVDRLRWRRAHAAEAAARADLSAVLAPMGLTGPLPDPLALTGDATLVFTSRGFQPDADRSAPHHQFVGPVTGARGAVATDLPWAALRAPLVYVSFGTMFTPRRGLLAAAVEGLSGLAGTVLVSSGTGPVPRSVPSDVLVRRTVPQLAVLERAAAMVTHGGMNSVQEALLAGVPLVVVPHGADQPLVGARVAEAGAGIVLPPARASARALRRAVAQVLFDPGYARRARALGADLAAAGGARAAADVIRRVAAGRSAGRASGVGAP